MDSKKMKCGDIRVALDEEPVIWMDRKRVTIFALPWSFTKYELTPSRLTISTGLINQREEEVRLYRVKDVTYTQSLIERIGGTGTLRIISNDASVPEIHLDHIKNARKVKDVISQSVEIARRENGVRTSELMGGGPGPGGPFVDNDGAESLGPNMVPDFDGNGIDDRTE
ncbi:MAG: PH domain-containing protein [Oscillospiraceae bacterium]|nr:PH domain-containing protein [Oscillospiraceae bacterium]